jgi:ketosteroid isomerase-like protein
MLLPPNQSFVEGRDAIVKFWAPFIAEIDGKLDIKEVVVQGDMAYVLGTYELSDAEGGFVDRGKYIELWWRTDGKWALHRDIWNSSLPVPGTKTD